MPTTLPTDPHDPRWRPSRRGLILIGACIQAFFILLGVVLYAANRERQNLPLLVREVLIPEDMVYRDTEVAPKRGVRLPPVDVRKVSAASPAQIKDGEALFKEHCVSCHGAQGKGDGTAGTALNPKPRDLTSLDGWKKGTRLSDLYTTLALGLDGTQMPAFDYLSVEERFAAAHYVISLAAGHRPDTQASLDSLDARFSLSEGAQEPNVVPLSLAMEKLVSEATPVPSEPDAEQQAALAAAEPQGAALFARVTRPGALSRLAYTLSADASWVGNPDRLRTLATGAAPENGFAARAALLSREEWVALGKYLARRYGRK